MNLAGFSIAFVTIASSALAQTPMLVTTSWEVSANNGLSWQAGTVQLPQSQQSVLVRHVVTWGTPGLGDYLVSGGVIPRIQTVGQTGLSDTVSGIQRRQIFMQPASSGTMGRRFTTNEILVTTSATTPPTGPITFFTNDPILGTTFPANPVDVVQFQLNLDGTAGERVISDWVSNNSFYRVVSIATPGPYTYSFSHSSTSLIVIPTPTTLAMLAVTSSVLMRRRRS